jgi:hypothetical protein
MSVKIASSPFLKVKYPSFEASLLIPAEVCIRDASDILQSYPDDLAASLFVDILSVVDKYKQVFKARDDKTTCPRCGYPKLEEAP